MEQLYDRVDGAPGEGELKGRARKLLQQQPVELISQLAEEHCHARRRVELYPAINADGLLRMLHLEQPTKE